MRSQDSDSSQREGDTHGKSVNPHTQVSPPVSADNERLNKRMFLLFRHQCSRYYSLWCLVVSSTLAPIPGQGIPDQVGGGTRPQYLDLSQPSTPMEGLMDIETEPDIPVPTQEPTNQVITGS